MNYKSFKILKYKGICNPIEIDLSKKSILPIIGVNESGKTSVLEAILSFDSLNDEVNDGIHLLDTENFYDPSDDNLSEVYAYINITKKEFISVIKDVLETDESGVIIDEIGINYEEDLKELLKKDIKTDDFFIARIISTQEYKSSLQLVKELDDYLCKKVIKRLPYILYFDDFRDSIEQLIKIPDNEDEENQSKWIPYFQEVLKRVNEKYDIYELPNKSSNIRDSIIRSAENVLQEQLTKHWLNFSLEKNEPLKIELKYHNTNDIEVRIVEEITIDGRKEDRFFNIKNRSKGFFWYFNFIMKLEFNPQKRHHLDKETVYLLDEPGSFLHSTAQKKLCERLKSLSKKNKVIYCTHSPYLLNPDYIPINNILIATKTKIGEIKVEPLQEIPLKRKNAAFQPILHALQIIPVSLDYDKNNIVLTEGIYDFYAFNLFKKSKKLNFFPCSNADSIRHHISYMIFLGKRYSAIWDLDKDGDDGYKKAKKSFGDEECKKWGFYKKGRKQKVILQDLFEGIDLKLIKNKLNLSTNTKFTKTIVALYHSSKKKSILKLISDKTKENFSLIESEILERIKL